MQRVHELVTAVRIAHPGDLFFHDFAATLSQNPLKQACYRTYERAFSFLDEDSWKNLKEKATAHFPELSSQHQLKAHFFEQLNDAFAYRWLTRRGFSSVKVVRENNVSHTKCPDIEFKAGNDLFACDVKTIRVSDDEATRRNSEPRYHDRSEYKNLSDGLFNKISTAIEAGFEQIQTRSTTGLVFIIIHSDDFSGTFHAEHRKQIGRRIHAPSLVNVPVVLKFGVHGRRRIERVANLPSVNGLARS